MSTTETGPWTRHGHRIEGLPDDGGKRPARARCGGPDMCRQCALDVQAARTAAAHAPAAVEGLEVPEHLGTLLRASSGVLASVLEPWVHMVTQRDSAISALATTLEALHASVRDLVALLENADGPLYPATPETERTLAAARELLARLAPEGDTP